MNTFFDRLHSDMLLGLFLRGAGAVSSFALIWMIARIYGSETVGLFQLGVVTAALLSILAGQGLDRIMVREGSIALAKNRQGQVAEMFAQARNRQFLVGAVICMIVIAGADLLAERFLAEPEAAIFLRIMAPAVLAIALIRLCSSLLRASGRVLISQSLDGVGYTTSAALLVGGAWLLGRADNPALTAAAYLIGVLLVMGIGLWAVHRISKNWHREEVKLPVAPGLRIAAFNGLASGNDWIGLVLLTAAEGASGAGIYRVAFQFCLLFSLINASFAMMVGPHIAPAAAKGDRAAVVRVIRTASKLGIFLSLPLLILLLIFAETALSLFGSDFEKGADALRVLAIAQFVNVAFGPVGAALTMMHREKAVLMIEIVAAGAGVCTTILLLPSLGMTGVAVGVLIAVVLRNSMALIVLKRHLAGFAPS